MERYTFSLRVLHWVMALGFIFMWACGYAMTAVVEDDSSLQELLFSLHIYVGVTLLFLLAARIAIRILAVTPRPLSSLANWEKVASHLGHIALYILPALVILMGWAEVDVGGHQVRWFGIAMPKIFPTMETFWGINLESTTELFHKVLAYSMLAVVIVHIAAVIKHRVEGHDVLKRMTFR